MKTTRTQTTGSGQQIGVRSENTVPYNINFFALSELGKQVARAEKVRALGADLS